MSRLIFPSCRFGWREGLECPAILATRGFFGVVHTQSFQTGEPFLIRCSGRDILAALNLITFSLQAAKQFFQVGTGWQEPVDGRFQLSLIGGAVLRSLMFDIALSFVLSGDDDGQTVFLAKPVRSAADIVITPLVGMIVLVIRKADRIENQVVMNMIFVYMGGKYKFILAAQDFFCKLHADLMGLFRRDLPRLKGLDQVTAQVRSLVDGMAAGPGKFDIRSFGGTAIGGYKKFSVRLFRGQILSMAAFSVDLIGCVFVTAIKKSRCLASVFSRLNKKRSCAVALISEPPFLFAYPKPTTT